MFKARGSVAVVVMTMSVVVVAACSPTRRGGGGGDHDNNGSLNNLIDNNHTNNGTSNNGVSNNGPANNGVTNNGANNGPTNNGISNNGVSNNGPVNNGTTNNGTTNNGTTNNGGLEACLLACPDGCPAPEQQLCGADGQLYCNACELACHGVVQAVDPAVCGLDTFTQAECLDVCQGWLGCPALLTCSGPTVTQLQGTCRGLCGDVGEREVVEQLMDLPCSSVSTWLLNAAGLAPTACEASNNGQACEEDTTRVGQVRPPVEVGDPSGGVPTTVRWGSGYDANLDELLAQVPVSTLEPDNRVAVDVQLVEATVIATLWVSPTQPVRRANREFYLADGRGAIKVFFIADATTHHTPFDVRVGQRVSVRVTEVQNYYGLPEVTAVQEGSWQLISEDNAVYIDDRTGEPITLADVNHLVRLTGTISGAGTACGTGYFCFPVSHGTETVTLRTESTFVMPGSCVTYVGPVAVFQDSPQLNALNFDWLWVN